MHAMINRYNHALPPFSLPTAHHPKPNPATGSEAYFAPKPFLNPNLLPFFSSKNVFEEPEMERAAAAGEETEAGVWLPCVSTLEKEAAPIAFIRFLFKCVQLRVVNWLLFQILFLWLKWAEGNESRFSGKR